MTTHTVPARVIAHLCVLDLVGSALDALAKTVEQLEDDQRGAASVLASKVAQAMNASAAAAMTSGTNQLAT